MALKKGEINEIAGQKIKGSGLKKKGAMKQHNFRMSDADYQELKLHFEDKGLSVGSGIRMIIYEYMDANNLR